MIYLIDEQLSDISHSGFLTRIISEHSTTEVNVISLPATPTFTQIYETVENLIGIVSSSDIVLCAWATPANNRIDSIFEELCEKCWVVVAAGNSSAPIENYSPTRVSTVITVGCLNKSGNKASLSNFSNTKQLEWVPGTNYTVGDRTESGTSVSAALYAAFLSKAINQKDHSLINKLIEQRKQQVKTELNDKYNDNMALLKDIDFQTIEKIWRDYLWVGRISKIESHSAMLHSYTENDMGNFLLPNWYHGCYVDGEIVGVNSGHICTDNSVRSRGLWVHPNHRKCGYGKQLLMATIDEARSCKALSVWSYPRKSSWPTYASAGFHLTSDWAASETSEANAYCNLRIMYD